MKHHHRSASASVFRPLLLLAMLLGLLPAYTAPTPVEAATVNLTVTARNGANQQGIAGAEIMLLEYGIKNGSFVEISPPITGTTNVSGTVTFSLNRRATYDVVAVHKSWVQTDFVGFSVTDEMVQTGGNFQVAVDLEPVRIAGRAVTDAGQGVRRALLEFRPTGTPISGGVYTDPDGAFRIGQTLLDDVGWTAGSPLEFRATPPEGNDLLLDAPRRTITPTTLPFTITQALVLQRATKFIRGTVVRKDPGPIGDVSVGGTRQTPEGSEPLSRYYYAPTVAFTLPVRSGIWSVGAGTSNLFGAGPQVVGFAPDDSLETKHLTFTLTGPQLTGQVVDTKGEDLSFIDLDLLSAERSTKITHFGHTFSGEFTIGALTTPGTYYSIARPDRQSQALNEGRSFLPSDPVSMTVAFDASGRATFSRQTPTGTVVGPSVFDAGRLVLPEGNKFVVATIRHAEGKVLGGYELDIVPTTGGDPLRDLSTQLRPALEPTAVLTMPVRPGSWSLTPRPNPTGGRPADWVYLGPPQSATFSSSAVTETISMTFTVYSTPHTIMGEVRMPDGSLPPDGSVQVGVFDGVNGFSRHVSVWSGHFETRVPTGTYELDVVSTSPENLSPEGTVGPFTIPQLPTQTQPVTLTVPTLRLVRADADISGRVIDFTGRGLANVQVTGYNRATHERVVARTNADGRYTLFVRPGLWEVDASPTAEQGLVQVQDVRLVDVRPGEHETAIDFLLARGDAGLRVVAQDANGRRLADVAGTVEVRLAPTGTIPADVPPQFRELVESYLRTGAPIGYSQPLEGGEAVVLLPAIPLPVIASLSFPPGSPYLSSQGPAITMTGGVTLPYSVTAVQPDAVLSGTLTSRSGPVTGLRAEVVAHGPNGTMRTEVDPATGRYSMRVKGPTLFLGLLLPPDAPWSWSPDGQPSIVVNPGSGATYNFELQPTTGRVFGVVSDPDGAPLGGAFVEVTVPPSGTVPPELIGGMTTGADGRYDIQVTGGLTLEVRARTGADKGFVHPPKADCFVGSGIGATCEANLRFRRADATIVGTVVSGTTPVRAPVRAYSENGGAASARADATGRFTLTIATGDTVGDMWHVDAVYQTAQQLLKSGERVVATRLPTTTYPITLAVGAPLRTSRPIEVTFDAIQPQTIELSNGFRLIVPGGALATQGRVTVQAFPTGELHKEGVRRPLDLGYSLLAFDSDGALITKFNANVLIEIPYDKLTVPLGLSAESLVVYYFDEASRTWIQIAGATNDLDNSRIVFLVDHFTDFATLTTEEPTVSSAAATTIYLPIVLSGDDANKRLVSEPSAVREPTPPDPSPARRGETSWRWWLPSIYASRRG